MNTNEILAYNQIDSDEDLGFAIKRMETIHQQQNSATEAPHRHHYYTLIWVKEGQGIHTIDFKDYSLDTNTIFFVNPGQVHQLQVEGMPKGEVILFTDEFLATHGISTDFINNLRIFRDCDENPPLYIDEGKAKRLATFCQSMHDLSSQQFDYRNEAIGAYLKLFLIECHRTCTIEPTATTPNAKQYINKQFKELVEQHYKTWHKVKEYAQHIGITSGHLNDTIKNLLGVSAKTYIQHRIALEAKRMAIFTDTTAKSIGYELGFSEPSHFQKFFKKEVGMPFSTFKKQY